MDVSLVRGQSSFHFVHPLDVSTFYVMSRFEIDRIYGNYKHKTLVSMSISFSLIKEEQILCRKLLSCLPIKT